VLESIASLSKPERWNEQRESPVGGKEAAFSENGFSIL
jgi:hypothetical protein